MARGFRNRGIVDWIGVERRPLRMTVPEFPIAFENTDLLVINKPAGLVCHPTKNGPMSSLIGRLRLYLGDEAEIHMINRLDRETSGLVMVAKDLGSAGFLRRCWERRLVKKVYIALVHGHPDQSEFENDGPLGKDEASEVTVKDCVRADGAPSLTKFQVLQRITWDDEPFSLVEARPMSGRKHQIRIHLSHSGFPIVGDKLYGIVPGAYLDVCMGRLRDDQRTALRLGNHALHAMSLELPLLEESHRIIAPIDASLREFCVRAGIEGKWLPVDTDVDERLGTSFRAAVDREQEEIQLAKRSSWSGSRRK